ncbi:alpha-tocopherol transfer protein-like [Trichonephila inaurata madagascariensis]|uniref:Alpha-tocopherol transfer protein-like n=1 Tax=Trichonephila inaurata madagascariensis TaxID=2747483 RepID=A0A8X7CMW2_9ARAC|nr:alpha-tocopherol transfer protein-like [Trichonephila inaurata madagascariensis]
MNRVLKNPITQLYGVTAIIDYSGFQYRSLFAYSPRLLHILVDTLQNTLPLRVKACHVINLPFVLSSVVNIVYSLISKKLKSRVFIHPSNDKWKSLHESFSLDILPEQFGGYVKQSDMIDLLSNVEDMEEEFLQHLNFGFYKTKQQREMKRLNPPIKDTRNPQVFSKIAFGKICKQRTDSRSIMNTQLRRFDFSDYLLDDELLESIRTQQNETPKTRLECLKSFRDKLSGKNHSPKSHH